MSARSPYNRIRNTNYADAAHAQRAISFSKIEKCQSEIMWSKKIMCYINTYTYEENNKKKYKSNRYDASCFLMCQYTLTHHATPAYRMYIVFIGYINTMCVFKIFFTYQKI